MAMPITGYVNYRTSQHMSMAWVLKILKDVNVTSQSQMHWHRPRGTQVRFIVIKKLQNT